MISEPGFDKGIAAMFGHDPLDGGMVGFAGRRAECECDRAETQFEKAIAAPGLAVVIALGCCPCDDLNLPIVQSEAPVDCGNLRFDRAFIGKEDPRRAAFDNGRSYVAPIDVGERLGREDNRRVLLAQCLRPFAQLLRKGGSSSTSQPSSMMSSVGRPSNRPSMRWKR